MELWQDLIVYSHFDDLKVDQVETEIEEEEEERLAIDDGDETVTHERETSLVLSDVEVRHLFEMVRDSWAGTLEPHQCLYSTWIDNGSATMLAAKRPAGVQRWLGGLYCCAQAMKHNEESTLAFKPRADVTRSPKQEYQWPHKKDWCPPQKKN